MVCSKKNIYIIGLTLFVLMLVSGIMLWRYVLKDNGRQQDKVYSGAKFVYNQEYPINKNYEKCCEYRSI